MAPFRRRRRRGATRQPRENPGTSMAFGWWSSGSAATLPVELGQPATGARRLVPYRSAAVSAQAPGRRARTSPIGGFLAGGFL